MTDSVLRLVILTLAALCVHLWSASCASAWQGKAAANQQRTYQPGEIHLGTSRAFIHVGKTGFGHEHGVVGRIKRGSVLLDAIADAGVIEFDMTTFVADTAAARAYVGLEGKTDDQTQRQATANMLGAEVLNVDRYPTATFRIKSAQRLDRPSRRKLPQYRLDGEFTLHGEQRPLTVVADVEERGGWLHLRGGFSILQSEYGMQPYTRAFGAVGVADKLNIWGDLWIAKQRLMATE
ncbi:MAG: YceI family protein [Pirellulaceae bacterium]